MYPTNATVLYPPPPAGNTRRPFLTPIPGLPGEFLLVLDNTSLDKIKRCHKAAQAYLILGREERPRSAALAYGGAIHAGLELFHTHQYNKSQTNLGNCKVDRPCDTAAQDQAILDYFTQNPAPSGDYRNPQSALAVLAAYRQRCDTDIYPDYEWEILSDEKGPIIERAFEIPMGVLELGPSDLSQYIQMSWLSHEEWLKSLAPICFNPEGLPIEKYPFVPVHRIHLAWSGRIDLIARISGNVHIVDHKTSSIDHDAFLQGFQMSSQTIGYTWAAKTLFPEFNISRFALNCIQFKKPAEGKGPMDRGPRGGPPALNLYRAYFQYSEERIARWLNDTQLLIEDFLHSVSRNHFPLNDRACFDKYGRCPYWDTCTVDNEEIGDRLLMSEAFKEVTWNPTT